MKLLTGPMLAGVLALWTRISYQVSTTVHALALSTIYQFIGLAPSFLHHCEYWLPYSYHRPSAQRQLRRRDPCDYWYVLLHRFGICMACKQHVWYGASGAVQR